MADTWTDEQAADATICVLSEDFTVATLRSWFKNDGTETPGPHEWVSRRDHARGMLQVGRALLTLEADRDREHACLVLANEVAAGWEKRALAAEAERERAEENEQARWQARFEFLHREYGVDGGGCDSGDPLDFTEAEVRASLTLITDERDDALAAVRELRDALWSVHWVQPSYNGNPSCSWCGVQKHMHDVRCGIDDILTRTDSPGGKRT